MPARAASAAARTQYSNNWDPGYLTIYETNSTRTYGLVDTEFRYACIEPPSLSLFKNALRKKRYDLLKLNLELGGSLARYYLVP